MNGRDLIVLGCCALLFVALVLPLRGSIVDDTYIHLQYARNLAEAGELSFNRGDPTYGATSPLWVVLLAAVHRGGGDLVLWCRILSGLFGIATVMLVYRLVLALGHRRSLATAAAVITAAEGWLLRWSAVGMETSFAAFMVLSVLWAALPGNRRSIRLGVLLLLAVLSRPEALLLAPLALIVGLLSRERPARSRFGWLLVFVPLVIGWFVLIKWHTGTIFPLTAGAKQGRLVFSIAVFERALVPAKIIGLTLMLPFLSGIAGIVAGLLRAGSMYAPFVPEREVPARDFRPADAPSAGVLLMILWIIALPAAYILFDFQILSRYLVPVLPPVIVLGVLSFDYLTARAARARNALLVVFTVIAVVQSVLFYTLVIVPPTRAFSRGINEVLVPMGEWLAEHTEPAAVVACPDIGAIGFVSNRTVLDLGGLVTPEINSMRRTIDVERIIGEGLYLRFAPDYLVDRHTTAARFSQQTIRGFNFEPVMTGTVANLGIRKPGPVVYVLYRLTPAGPGASMEN